MPTRYDGRGLQPHRCGWELLTIGGHPTACGQAQLPVAAARGRVRREQSLESLCGYRYMRLQPRLFHTGQTRLKPRVPGARPSNHRADEVLGQTIDAGRSVFMPSSSGVDKIEV